MSPTDAGRPRRAAPDPSHFRHSYSKDKAQLVRRLSRMEGQVRGIARMIEREEYCVDILQQTAALRAAVDALSILVLEDHVQGCVRTAAEAGRGRPVRRRGHRRRPPDARPAGPRRAGGCDLSPSSYPRIRAAGAQFVDNPVDARPRRPVPSGIRTGAEQGNAVREGFGETRP